MTLNKENFCQKLGLQHPIFCGPMFPCSNPELVAAASAAGILGVMQPLSMTYSHGWDFQDGMDYMKSVTPNPIGMNALIESSTQRHLDRMKKYVDLAIENGVRVIITSLGKPDWVVKKLEEVGGYVFHDVTQKKWAQIGADCGVHGLICVNDLSLIHI